MFYLHKAQGDRSISLWACPYGIHTFCSPLRSKIYAHAITNPKTLCSTVKKWSSFLPNTTGFCISIQLCIWICPSAMPNLPLEISRDYYCNSDHKHNTYNKFTILHSLLDAFLGIFFKKVEPYPYMFSLKLRHESARRYAAEPLTEEHAPFYLIYIFFWSWVNIPDCRTQDKILRELKNARCACIISKFKAVVSFAYLSDHWPVALDMRNLV